MASLSADYSWQALQYVCGELSAEQAAEFERLLEDDQAAREAVASAVALAEAVSLAGPSVVDRKRTLRQAAGWMATGAAACLLVVLGGRAVWQAAHPNEHSAARPSGERQGTLAQTWLELRGEPEPALLSASEPGVGLEDSTMLAEADGPPGLDAEALPEGRLPVWLLDAAALYTEELPSPGTREN